MKIEGEIIVTKEKGIFYNLSGVTPYQKGIIDVAVEEFLTICNSLKPFYGSTTKHFGPMTIIVFEEGNGWKLTFYVDDSAKEET